jgi:uncharacterized protein YceH (UPF0502 family)
MQNSRGARREIVLAQWGEQLRRAEKRLADSQRNFELFGDSDAKQRVAEDEERVNDLRKRIDEAMEGNE